MCEVKDTDGFKDLVYVGIDTIKKDAVIFELTGPIVSSPTRTSIQIDKDKHIEDKKGQYMNHSCDPTCYIKDGKVYAKHDIVKDTSLNFDYNSNEDCMATPFECKCCDKVISGKY